MAEPLTKRAQIVCDGMKLCTGCEETKPLGDFHVQVTALSGRAYECKVCVSRKASAKRAERSAERLATREAYYAGIPEDTKVCTGCGEVKDKRQFYLGLYVRTNMTVKATLQNGCRACWAERYKKDKEEWTKQEEKEKKDRAAQRRRR